MSNPKYAAAAIVESDYFDKMVERFRAGIEGSVTLQIHGHSPSGEAHRSLIVGDMIGNRVSITDVTHTGPTFEIKTPGDVVPLSLAARGPAPELLGDDIIDAAHIDRDAIVTTSRLSILPREFSQVMGPDATGIVGFFVAWSSGTLSVPVVIIHTDVPGDLGARVFRAARLAVPQFVRDATPVHVIDTPMRGLLNTILSTIGGRDVDLDFSIPRESVSVIHIEEESLLFPRMPVVLTKTPVKAFDGRKISSALSRAASLVPDFADLLLRTKSNGQDEKPEPGSVSADAERELESLRADLAASRTLAQSRADEVSQLSRELRLVRYELDKEASAAGDEEAVREVSRGHDAQTRTMRAEVAKDVALYEALRAMDVPTTMTGLCRFARTTLRRVEVPDYVDGTAQALDAHADVATWAQRAWRTLAAMEAFAVAGDDDPRRGDFRVYIKTLPAPPVGLKHVAMHDSKSVESNRRMRDERTFAVPIEVDESGRIYMAPHIRISASGSPPAPRMYFYDDTRGGSGKVHVGYIGPHLTTLSTKGT